MGEKEAIKVVQKSLGKLEKMKSYNNKDAMNELKIIGDCYWDFEVFRKEVGEALIEGKAADLFVKILKDLATPGYFKNDDVWFSAYYAFNNSWNFSDASLHFATTLGDAGMVKLCVGILDTPAYRQKLDKSKNVDYMCKACMSILHNLSKSVTLKHYFRDEKVVEKIQVYVECGPFLKALTMMVIAAIIEESEMAYLKDTGTIQYLIEMCEKAMQSKDRRCEGFSVKELVEGLERLAVNKENCKTVIESKGLETLKKVLSFHDNTEQVQAIKAIWSLAFDEDYSRPALIADQGILPLLEKLAKSGDKEVRKNAQGALWVVKGNTDKVHVVAASSELRKRDEKHVMISYQWDVQSLVVKIKDALKDCGYKVWIDVESMEGSTLQAMAEAVEDAETVLICITEKYKFSQNCRTEAEYAFQQRKHIVPLMLEQEYKPDGWLGMILGTKLYVEFRGNYDFNQQIPRLTKQIGQKQGVKEVVTAVDSPDVGSKPPTGKQYSVMNWPKDGVSNWLENIGLEKYVHRMITLTQCQHYHKLCLDYQIFFDKKNVVCPNIAIM
ncbi:uncharacterized protein LOC117104068, partial [Anneissia japonica]|uniref:uncharacterized protein LOC117104068 n=1 Tax=Anneissia japonica TaxID=1529436 RepID=UPI001425691A